MNSQQRGEPLEENILSCQMMKAEARRVHYVEVEEPAYDDEETGQPELDASYDGRRE